MLNGVTPRSPPAGPQARTAPETMVRRTTVPSESPCSSDGSVGTGRRTAMSSGEMTSPGLACAVAWSARRLGVTFGRSAVRHAFAPSPSALRIGHGRDDCRKLGRLARHGPIEGIRVTVEHEVPLVDRGAERDARDGRRHPAPMVGQADRHGNARPSVRTARRFSSDTGVG